MSRHHRLPGYEHATLIAPGVEARNLVEDHNGVPHVQVHEMHPEVDAAGRPPWKALNQAVNGCGLPQ